jgi:hypothetical protein
VASEQWTVENALCLTGIPLYFDCAPEAGNYMQMEAQNFLPMHAEAEWDGLGSPVKRGLIFASCLPADRLVAPFCQLAGGLSMTNPANKARIGLR